MTYRVDREGDSLKMSQLEVHHEWQLDHPPHSVAVVVVAILALITGGVLLTLLVAAVIYCLHRLIKYASLTLCVYSITAEPLYTDRQVGSTDFIYCREVVYTLSEVILDS